MAIAFDASSKGGNFGSTASGTVSHITTGSNTLMVVVVHTASSANTVSSITYNGTSFTGSLGAVANGSRNTDTWYLIGPATGTHDVVVTVASAGLVAWGYSVATYTGVTQTSPLDVSGTAAAADPMRVTLTTTVDNCWLIGGACVNGTLAVGSNTTARGTVNTSLEQFQIVDTNAAQTPTGSYSFGTTGGDTNSGGMSGGAFKPAIASGPANLKSLDTNLKANIKSYNTNLIANIKSINTNT